MARETKVGLLAGLAFIICFAVILANRGRQVPLPEQSRAARFHFAQGGQSAPRGRTTTARRSSVEPSGPAPRLAADRGSEIRQSNRLEPRRRVPANEDSVADTSHDSRRADAHRTAAQQAADLRILELEQRLDELSQELAARNRNNLTLTAPAGTDGSGVADPARRERRAPAQQASPHAGEMVDRTIARSAGPRNEPSSGSRQILARYKVEKGDTLSGIASAHYRAKSKRYIDALMDANRGVLADPNMLRVGMDLVIPVVDRVPRVSPTPARRSAGKQDRPREQQSRARRETHAPFRWYQIKPHDRYVGIARRELGDESRWREIFEMNKAVFPDPSRIRPGVRIKLPAVAVADNREGWIP